MDKQLPHESNCNYSTATRKSVPLSELFSDDSSLSDTEGNINSSNCHLHTISISGIKSNSKATIHVNDQDTLDDDVDQDDVAQDGHGSKHYADEHGIDHIGVEPPSSAGTHFCVSVSFAFFQNIAKAIRCKRPRILLQASVTETTRKKTHPTITKF